LAPQKFAGELHDNGWYWLEKFEAYCARLNIVDNNRISTFILLITGPCENWYMLLPNDQKDTYPHLRAAFLARFTGDQNNLAANELFYTRMQLPGESVAKYIDEMMTIGNKIQINANQIISQIKRGLAPPIKMHVLSHNINDLNTLIQQATIAENYQPLMYAYGTSTTTPHHVHFNTNTSDETHGQSTSKQFMDDLTKSNNALANKVENLTRKFEQLNISTVSDNRQRTRSPTPIRDNISNTNNNTFARQDNRNNTQPRNTNYNTKFCTYCQVHGHTSFNCSLRQFQSVQQSYAPRQQFRSNQPFDNRQNYNQPWQNFAQRDRWPQSNYQGYNGSQARPQNNWSQQTRYSTPNRLN
jgi:hypothetical protein